jgi:hypothetical protein
MNPDDLDDLLSTSPAHPADDRREIVWQQTTRLLHRRKVRRDITRIASYVLLVGLGACAAWLLKPANPPPELAAQPPSPPALTTVVRTAQQLELDAERTDEVMLSAQLYRQAGDRYLDQGSDIRSALRCYRLHLDLQGDHGLQALATDSWLLLSLKRAHAQGELQ